MADVLVGDKLDVYPAVLKKNYFNVALGGDQLRLTAGNWVGLIPLNDRVAINVIPKVGIRRFARLLAMAEGEAVALELTSRGFAPADDTVQSILDALARALIREVQTIRHRGLHKVYRERHERTSFPKGRIDRRRTVEEWARGRTSTVVTRWHERTVDTDANRLLRYSILYMAALYRRLSARRHRDLLGKLSDLDRAFEHVRIDYGRRFARSELVRQPANMPSSRAYYVAGMNLANALIRRAGIELHEHQQALLLESLIFNLEDLFERYVRNVLRRELKKHAPAVRVLNGNEASKLLFADPPDRATPDFVVRGPGASDRTRLIGEVKYIDRLPKPDERNQLIAYATTFGSPVSVLVQPAGDDRRGLYRRTRIGAAEFWYYAIELETDNPADEEQRFGNLVAAAAMASGPP